MLTLNQAKKNKFYTISSISFSSPNIARRLLELGFTPRQRVKIQTKSISNGTLLVLVRGYLLSVRADVGKFVILSEDKA